jgi:hypothetical protein
LGIVGMHGLAQGGHTAPAAGHHVAQAVDMVPAASVAGDPVVSDEPSPGEHPGLLALCLMVLVPAVGVGLWLLGRSRVGGWRLRREPVLAMRALELAVPPQPLWRQLRVLRV